jgi:outer membrane protein assembly factor BamB
MAYNPISGRLEWQFNDGKYATPIVGAGRLIVSGATHVYVLRPLK